MNPKSSSSGDRRVGLVTGASRGIGARVCERLASGGWDLTISARDQAALDVRANELRERYSTTVNVVCADMADADSLDALVSAHSREFETLDGLVLNAGMGRKGRISDVPVHRLDRLYEVNVRAPYILMQSLLPLLRSTAAARGSAKVIALASITGVYPEAELSAYGATKAALISLCETFNLEESEHGVSASTVSPGYVDTDMSSWTGIPPREMITADDVASVVANITELSRYAVIPSVVMTRPGSTILRA
ncbi:SDR family NAD(P)-dependent oxidoreductase [Nocardia carnea]|uniref:SDR family NAD(P)-dependent oxidoreductase n=1 Tax=Nocardia carnea TaxID=37328 RepID=UPI002453EF25|nr:SDR family oxidoreductase [Nocardia carnea]